MMHFVQRTSRYTQVGLLCALLNNAIVIGLDQERYPYALGVCMAFVFVTPIGYLLHASYTFRVPASGSGGLRFLVASLIGFPLSMTSMFVMCSGIGLRASLAMPLTTVLLFVWNYSLAHFTIARPARFRV